MELNMLETASCFVVYRCTQKQGIPQAGCFSIEVLGAAVYVFNFTSLWCADEMRFHSSDYKCQTQSAHHQLHMNGGESATTLAVTFCL